MDRAISVAGLSTQRFKHGAVIVKSGRVLSVGVNTGRNIPTNCTDPKAEAALCAERAAIRAYGGDLSGATIYVARVGRDGKVRMSAPCVRCQHEIALHHIKRAVWTTGEEI